jgi:hypothetical protein
VVTAVRLELERTEVSGSALGAAALVLAARLDRSSSDTGSGVAALVRELRATMAEAMRNRPRGPDPLTMRRAEIATRRAAAAAKAPS